MTKKEYIEKYGEEAYKEHLKKCKAYNKAYNAAHREEILAKQKVYDAVHREERKEYKKAYYKAYSETPHGRAKYLLSRYRQSDRERNLGETTITSDWIVDNIFTSSCTYCGETDWHKLGTDRIDNTKPHTTDNVVCACASCNTKRGSIPFREFLLSANPSEAAGILSSLGLGLCPNSE